MDRVVIIRVVAEVWNSPYVGARMMPGHVPSALDDAHPWVLWEGPDVEFLGVLDDRPFIGPRPVDPF